MCQFVPALTISPVEAETIDAEISKFLSEGIIVNTARWHNDFVSKGSNYRMILNLKTFNEFLKFKH